MADDFIPTDVQLRQDFCDVIGYEDVKAVNPDINALQYQEEVNAYADGTVAPEDGGFPAGSSASPTQEGGARITYPDGSCLILRPAGMG